MAVFTSIAACADDDARLSGFSATSAGRQVELEDRLIGAPNALRIQDHHRELAKAALWPGTSANAEAAEYIGTQLRDFGFDSIEVHEAEVRLPVPRIQRVHLVGANTRTLPLGEPSSGFAAFSADGDVTAEVVFANLGTPSDYDTLADLGLDVQGRIVLVRHAGRVERAVLEASARGAVGALVFVDPADGPGSGVPAYPEGPRRPADSAPSLAVPTQTGIPVQPIPSTAAHEIFAAADGALAPDAWQGGVGVDYRLSGAVVRIELAFEWTTRTVTNVIALLVGDEHPDEWVVVGSPRDAWGGGGASASGMATVLETARALGRQVRRGHRPRRTVAIASWDGSAWGRIGSTRWAGSVPQRPERIVAYIERAGYGMGPFTARGSPSMQPLVNAAARLVRSPAGPGTIYDEWMGTAEVQRAAEGQQPWVDHGGWTDVRLAVPTGHGDHESLLLGPGVPTVELGFGTYDLAGSALDTHDAFRRFGDPGFEHGERLAELTALVVTRLANAEVPPLDWTATSEAIDRALDGLAERAREFDVRLRLRDLRETNSSLALNAAAVNAAVDGVLSATAEQRAENQALAAALSAALVLAERDLVEVPEDGNGPGGSFRPTGRHVLYAPDSWSAGATLLPDVYDAIHRRDAAAAQAGIERTEAHLARVVERLRTVLERARKEAPAN